MLNRIERHDVVNALALAVALLLCGYVVLRWFDFLGETWSGGLWDSEKVETMDDAELARRSAEVAVVGSKPPNEVTVRIGNGSDGRDGLAGRATDRLASVGYGTLRPENKSGDPIDESMIYYADGFRPDALQIAALLGLDESDVRPLPDVNLGVTVEGADVVVVLGNTAPI